MGEGRVVGFDPGEGASRWHLDKVMSRAEEGAVPAVADFSASPSDPSFRTRDPLDFRKGFRRFEPLSVQPVDLLDVEDGVLFGEENAAFLALGAPRVNLLVYLRDPAEVLDKTAEFCRLALDLGLGVAIELAPVTTLKTLGQTADLARAIGRPGQVGVNLDILHLYRSGGTPADIAAHRDDIIYAQTCDGPLERPADEWRDEGGLQRDRPGEGEMDVRGFLAALRGTPVSVEVPDQRRRLAGESALTRARDTRVAAETVLQP